MNVDAIKEAISELPENDKVTLAAWLTLQTMDEWDREMPHDFSPGGRGYQLVDKVKAQIRAGSFRPMPEGKPAGKE